MRRLRIWGIKDGKRIYLDEQGLAITMDPEVPEILNAKDKEKAFKEYVDQIIDTWTGEYKSDKDIQKWADAWNKHEKDAEPPVLLTADEMRKKYQFLIETVDEQFFQKPTQEEREQTIKEYEYYLSLSDEQLNKKAKKKYEHDVKWYGPYDIDFMREIEYSDFERNNQCPWDWNSIQSYLDEHPGDLTKATWLKYDLQAPKEKKLCRECLNPCEWIWYECFPGPLCGSAGWVAICKDCKSWHKEITVIMS